MPHGRDEIEFLVSANPGQPLEEPGEGRLRRRVVAHQSRGPGRRRPRRPASLCMVFDEVDAGIGGAIAEIVGRQLRTLGERAPGAVRDASGAGRRAGARQFRVTKQTDGKTTRTAVQALAPPTRR